jgi:hypothetical protein
MTVTKTAPELKPGKYSVHEESLLKAVTPSNKPAYARNRLDELSGEYHQIHASNVNTPSPEGTRAIRAVEERLAALVSISPHAAVHMVESSNPLSRHRFETPFAFDYENSTSQITYPGTTLSHVAAANHPEFQVFILRDRYDGTNLISAFKRELLSLQNSAGLTVREIAKARLSEFLRLANKEDFRIG